MVQKGILYILQSEVNSRYYIGSTNNLDRRLSEHNNGFSGYTKFTIPFKLVFKQEYQTIEKARQIEFKLKKLKSRRIITKIIEDKTIRLDS